MAMELYERLCKNCGGDVYETDDGRFKCRFCGSVYELETVIDYEDEMKKLFDEVKFEAVSNAKRNLYEAVNAEYISSKNVHECCVILKQLLPDDFQANFFETVISATGKKTAKAIRKIDLKENSDCVESVIRFLILSLKSEFISEVADLIEKAFKQTDLRKYREYSTMLSTEAEKLDKCIYMTSYPRDVFVAYSSKDMEKVLELVEVLEEQGLSCFIAARNLRHGAGAVENYENALREAMDNCQSFVLVSSMNSRHPGCDALRQELPYVKEADKRNAPAELRNDYVNIPQKYKKHRVEYRLEESSHTMAADRIVSEFFAGYERVYSPIDVAERVLNRSVVEVSPTRGNKPQKAEKNKYCVDCLSECAAGAKFCSNCGGSSFADTVREAELMKKIAEMERQAAQRGSAPAPTTTAAPRPAAATAPTPTASPSQTRTQPSTTQPTPTPAPAKPQATKPTIKASEGLKFEIDETHYGLNKCINTYSVVGIGTCKDSNIIIPAEYRGMPVTKIGNGAFRNNIGITSVTIPDSVTSIEEYAFYNCAMLNTVVISAGVKTIDHVVFDRSNSLTNINVSPDNQEFKSINGSLYNKEGNKLLRYAPGRGTSIVIPYNVTTIGFGSFAHSSITNVTLPESIKTIDIGAFSGCSYLKSIVIPETVTYIGSYTFRDCPNLKTITFKSPERWQRWGGGLLSKIPSKILSDPQKAAEEFTSGKYLDVSIEKY